jgi:ribosomal protein S18 acetylase RimI-like enzyme
MRSSIEIAELDAKAVLGRQRDEIEELWRLVFPETTDERFAEILPRHTERRGFRFLAARDDDRLLAGFAYGYLGGPGEWWHDRVSAALGSDLTRRWLPTGHFEFVELQVHPSYRRRGLGGRLHDSLLEGLNSPTAVLSTQRDNGAAIALYEARGWQIVLDEILFGDESPPYVVMGRDLPRA